VCSSDLVRVNEAYARACRRDISEFAGRNHFEMYPSNTKEIFDEVVRTKRPFETFARPFVYADQPERGVTYWDWTLTPVKIVSGAVDGLVFSLHETTERKMAEKRIQHLASFPALNPNPVLEIDRSGKVTFANDTTRSVLRDQGLEDTDASRFLPGNLDVVLERLGQGEGGTFEREVRMGRRTFAETLYLTPQFGTVRIYGYDITERKAFEAALTEREEQLRLFIEHAPVSLAMFDREMRYLSVSLRWMSEYGLGDRGIIGRSHYDVFPETPERWKEAHQRGLAGEVVKIAADRFERQDGSVQWLSWEIRPWHNAEGIVGGIVIFTDDITERKKAEEALQQHMEEMRRANEELERFNRVAVGRELRMIELKREINALCADAGLPLKYPLDFGASK
jgi:PAS domain S-box-containing protein